MNARGGNFSTSINNKFYLTGGSQIDGVTKLVEFDPEKLTFREMLVPVNQPGGAYLIFCSDDYLYLGGSKEELLYKIPVSDLHLIYK